MSDLTDQLKQEFDNRPVQRSGRLRTPKAKSARYANSFVPRTATAYIRKKIRS